ncbi:serine hydrolase [Halospeciosus flavus]|uniref:Serine hydrolase n=1 Tax=Halospeciosus flavus TaxID=3032283 RepID=A0ABD5Z986_9EURY|nr:serine hydrolase [Halospeciosus flavus]
MNPDTSLDGPTRREIESFVADWVAEHDVPGAALVVVDGDETVYADGFGARDLAAEDPATPDTRFGIASVTKSVTAVAVQQLAARGDLALDDFVGEYVPRLGFPDDPVSVADLLSHTSGMPSDGASIAHISRALDVDPNTAPLSSETDRRRHVDDAKGDRTTSDPHTHIRSEERPFFYYNTGYTILGEVVEAVDGRPFRRYVEEEVLDPLRMAHSGFDPDTEDAAVPYYHDPETGDLERGDFPAKGTGAAGGLLSTATDLGRYLRFHLTGNTGVLPDERRHACHEGHATRETRLDGSEQQYGYGWMREPFLDDTLVSHSGTLTVSSAFAGFREGAEVGVGLLASTVPDVHPSAVGRGVLALLDGTSPDEAVARFGLDAKFDAVTGQYASHRGIQRATVEREHGGVRVDFDNALGGETLVAFPETSDPDDYRFYTSTADGAHVPLTFEETDDGFDLFYRRWRLHGST